jgi:putative protease
LSYQCHIDEITKICEADIMEIEVFGYLCCSFYNGACNLIHEMGEVRENEEVLVGVPCKAEYMVSSNDDDKVCYPYLDAELTCGLCAVKKLKNAGVDVIKVAGRDRNSENIAQITSLFRKAIDMACNSNINFDTEIKALTNTWWKRIYCKKNRCKYTDNEVTRSYIGMMD